MESTPITRVKRSLASLYDESPNLLKNTIHKSSQNNNKMCDELKIKTSLVFDEDSTDSGFSDDFGKQQNITKFSVEDYSEYLSESFCEDIESQKERQLIKPIDSASKRMKILNDKFNDFDIHQILELEHEQAHCLIGDKSKKHVLPTLQTSKHRDLASISSHTMCDLIAGRYENEVEKYIIIDARYPYEFEGGHIESAMNLYLKDQLFDYLFKEPIKLNDSSKRLIVIFHCEFSSERGPKLMREIRERDRTINKHCYPQLHYPELYLLEGGYKNFFESYSECCLPKAYKPMLHDDHRNDLKFFRKKSKSWELETRRSRASKSKFLDF